MLGQEQPRRATAPVALSHRQHCRRDRCHAYHSRDPPGDPHAEHTCRVQLRPRFRAARSAGLDRQALSSKCLVNPSILGRALRESQRQVIGVRVPLMQCR